MEELTGTELLFINLILLLLIQQTTTRLSITCRIKCQSRTVEIPDAGCWRLFPREHVILHVMVFFFKVHLFVKSDAFFWNSVL